MESIKSSRKGQITRAAEWLPIWSNVAIDSMLRVRLHLCVSHSSCAVMRQRGLLWSKGCFSDTRFSVGLMAQRASSLISMFSLECCLKVALCKFTFLMQSNIWREIKMWDSTVMFNTFVLVSAGIGLIFRLRLGLNNDISSLAIRKLCGGNKRNHRKGEDGRDFWR